MEKMEIKVTLIDLLRKDIRSRLEALLGEERELVSAASVDRYAIDNLYESTAEETMQSERYASDLVDHFREVFNFLNVFPTTIMDEANLGAVVITDRKAIFIAANSRPIAVDGIIYNTISKEAPIFEAISGKKKGQDFSYKGLKFKIIDVF